VRFGARAAAVSAAAVVIGVAAVNVDSTEPRAVPAQSTSATLAQAESPTPTPTPEPSQEPGSGTQGPPKGWKASACRLPDDYLIRTLRGYFPGRSPNVTFISKEPHFFGNFRTTTTHSGPWDYVQHIPLVFYGPGYIRSSGTIEPAREVTLADIAPTFAKLLGTPFPKERPGQAVMEALLPKSERTKPPKLVMLVVWDGGGWNVLDEHPSAWPNLKRFMDEGTSVGNATVGSNPSVTPAIHANMGTGAFPNRHGIVSIPQRRGNRIEDSWAGHSPHNLTIKSLADMYDQRTRNRAKVGLLAEQDWHLGMIGHGAYINGGDRDIAVLTRESPFTTNSRYYRLPGYINSVPGFDADAQKVDLDDGKNNNRWLGHPLPSDPSVGFANPTWTLYQMRLLRKLLGEEGFGKDSVPDLFFTNFKQIDEVSHAYFMEGAEMAHTIPYSDRALAGLVRWMNEHVGKNRWVMAMTADHGVGPSFKSIGAWAIDMDELLRDTARHFGLDPTRLFLNQRPQGFWVDVPYIRSRGVTKAEISNYLLTYRIKHNVRSGQHVPKMYQDRMRERLFSAAWPSDKNSEVKDCL
jgi:Type I phosphodiesterase / nucleotide pyrophosphatase